MALKSEHCSKSGFCPFFSLLWKNTSNLPLGVVAQILGGNAGNEVAPNDMRNSLGQIFGGDASQTIQKYLAKIQELMAQNPMGGAKNESSGGLFAKLCGCLSGGTGAADAEGGKTEGFNIMEMASQFIGPGMLSSGEKLDDDVGILISGCQVQFISLVLSRKWVQYNYTTIDQK